MNQSCKNCNMYKNPCCSIWKVKITDLSAAETCQRFSAKPISGAAASPNTQSNETPMNKGLMIRQKKLAKQQNRRNTIKPNQEDLVRFVSFKVKVIERINGKHRHPERTEFWNGLQIENKIYTPDGHYKFVNRSTLTITKCFKGVPEWANEYLLDKYHVAINRK